MNEVVIVPHALKHGVSESDISFAWDNFVRKQHRSAPNEGEIVVVGFDTCGRLVELVAVETARKTAIYHAMRPPTIKILSELGLQRRRNESFNFRRSRKGTRHHK